MFIICLDFLWVCLHLNNDSGRSCTGCWNCQFLVRGQKKEKAPIYIAGSMGGKKNTEELQIKDKLKGATRIKRGKWELERNETSLSLGKKLTKQLNERLQDKREKWGETPGVTWKRDMSWCRFTGRRWWVLFVIHALVFDHFTCWTRQAAQPAGQ